MDFFGYNFNCADVIFACKVPAGSGNPVHKNRPSHGLALNIDGEKIYCFENGKKISVKKNDIIFLPENSSYEVLSPSFGDCYAINFKIGEKVDFSPFKLHIKSASNILNSFISAKNAFISKKTGYEAKCRAELFYIIYSLIREKDIVYTSESIKKSIAPAIDFIHNNYTSENINIKSLAALCEISETYFRRIFLRCFGVSPVSYINSLKLERAKEMLSQSECSLETAAEMSGFNNLSWFCRFFKNKTGQTPSEFRLDQNKTKTL